MPTSINDHVQASVQASSVDRIRFLFFTLRERTLSVNVVNISITERCYDSQWPYALHGIARNRIEPENCGNICPRHFERLIIATCSGI
jgi:hypothetical protein